MNNSLMKNADIIIIGGGIAGCSAGAMLSQTASVIILEQESHPGYHATGRSAATTAPYYGPEVIRQLTAMSTAYLTSPPASVSDKPFTMPRGEMILAGRHAGVTHEQNQIPDVTAKQTQALRTQALFEENLAYGMQPMSVNEAQELVSLLKPDAIDQVLYTDKLLSIDVDALHQSSIRQIRESGGELICTAQVTHLTRGDSQWQVTVDHNSVGAPAEAHYQAPTIINAAGAWADTVAQLAGLPAAGLQPKRRSAALVPFATIDNGSPSMDSWPLLLDIHEQFYSIPFGSGLMVSPADETPVEAHDVSPEEIDLATGIDNFQQLIDYDIQTISHRWAGLRTFAADGDPVVGFDPLTEGFFWLAGQGGYGIQTSPALARFCSYLINRHAGEDTEAFDRIEKKLSPARLNR